MRFRLPVRRRRAAVIALLGLVFLGAAVFSFAPIARGKAEAAARARGLEIRIGRARPAWFGVVLEDVEVRPEGVSTVVLRASEVRVDATARLAPEKITALGGVIELTGKSAIDDLLAWRERRPKSEGGGRAVALDASGMRATWVDGELDLTVEGLFIQRDEQSTRAGFDRASAQGRDLSAEVRGASAELVGGKLARARADGADVGVLLAPQASEGKSSQAEPAPPALPVIKRAGKPAPQPYGPIVVLPDLHELRARVRAVVSAIAARTASDVHVDVPAVSFAVTRGQDRVEVGPGSFDLSRTPTDLVVDFASRAAPGRSPLTLKLDAPLGAGDVIAELSGGPVTLALFGVKEGEMGLADVERATLGGQGRVIMTDAGDLLRFDGSIALKDASIRHDGIASDTVRGLTLQLASRGSISDRGKLELDDAALDMGSLHVRAHGAAEQASDHLAAELAFEVPTAGCESLRTSLPTALLPVLETARYRGTLGAKGTLAFDTRDLDQLVLRYEFDDRCKLDVVPELLEPDRFKSRFTYWAIDKDGRPMELESGPHTDRWTPLDEISPYMQTAVLTTEDGLFYKHKGFNHAAIRQSLIANLKAHKFVRGASTITMQLAKNLFLSREKTLARKLQEIALADALEKTLGKDDIMELYLNVIEFGPDIYGVTAAAEHYFGRPPSELNLSECLFLASLLPKPRESHKIWEKGEVPVSWVKNIHALMEIAAKTNKISTKELEDAQAETLVFHKDGDPPPPQRQPLRAPRVRAQDGASDDWIPAQ